MVHGPVPRGGHEADLQARRFSAQLLQMVLSGMADLLTSEGARRRARPVEITCPSVLYAHQLHIVSLPTYSRQSIAFRNSGKEALGVFRGP